MPANWDEAVGHALSLSGAEMSTSYGKPAVKVNGRAFLAPGREAGSFCLLIDLDTVDMLMATEPDTYWQTPHYAGWPAVLVRYGSADPARVRAMIGRAHAWNAARPKPKAKPRSRRKA
ncbi:MAG: MmcQ/YjbR family DNA-binding protein [Vitreimonas sp.]